jgi:hypothetical protein
LGRNHNEINDCAGTAYNTLIENRDWWSLLLAPTDSLAAEFVADYHTEERRLTEWCLCLWRLQVRERA